MHWTIPVVLVLIKMISFQIWYSYYVSNNYVQLNLLRQVKICHKWNSQFPFCRNENKMQRRKNLWHNKDMIAMVSIITYLNFLWNIVTYPCLNFYNSLPKPLWTSNHMPWLYKDIITLPWPKLDIDWANLVLVKESPRGYIVMILIVFLSRNDRKYQYTYCIFFLIQSHPTNG